LLMTAAPEDASAIQNALAAERIRCAAIGGVEAGPPVVWQQTGPVRSALTRPARDEVARVYQEASG
jgi:hydrogenase maturation factor